MSKFINGNGLIDPMEDIPRSNPSSNIHENIDRGNQSIIRPMQFEAKQKSFEEKIYLILYSLNHIDEDDPASRTFSVCIGRTMAYSDIKNKLLSGLDIDVHRSYVMTETRQTETKTGDIKYFMIPYEECVSIYAFCLSIEDFYSDDEFSIEDYADGDIPEDNRVDRGSTPMSSELIEYRRLLEESLIRGKFINDMRQIYGNDDSHNI